jgi:LmbE family N-acetylglucosaminyl deacetylase
MNILVISAHPDDLEINCAPFIGMDGNINQFTIFTTSDGEKCSLQSKEDLDIQGTWQFGGIKVGDYSRQGEIIDRVSKLIETLEGAVTIITHHPEESHTDHSFTSRIAKSVSRNPKIDGLIYWVHRYDRIVVKHNFTKSISEEQKNSVINSLIKNYSLALDYNLVDLEYVKKTRPISEKIINSFSTGKQHYLIEFLED